MVLFTGIIRNILNKLSQKPEKGKTEVKHKGVPSIQEKPKKKKMSYNEQREFETIEDDITGVEERLEEIAIELE